jgi:outer membrane protein assembly factor BamE (lipoprotein component of BamABCDE complex)
MNIMAHGDKGTFTPRKPLARERSIFRGLVLLCLILFLPLILGAWRDLTGKTINPRYVGRIQDGKTTKHEIFLWFGDPQEVDRGPAGVVFKYVSYKDAPELPSKDIYKEPNPQSTTPYYLDEEKRVKKLTRKTKGEIVQSTLTIRFKPDGETVMSHEYKEFDGNK